MENKNGHSANKMNNRGIVSAKKFEHAVRTLASLLRKKPLTAREAAEMMDCARGTAYARLKAVQESGFPVGEMVVPAPSGPAATAYFVMPKKREKKAS